MNKYKESCSMLKGRVRLKKYWMELIISSKSGMKGENLKTNVNALNSYIYYMYWKLGKLAGVRKIWNIRELCWCILVCYLTLFLQFLQQHLLERESCNRFVQFYDFVSVSVFCDHIHKVLTSPRKF